MEGVTEKEEKSENQSNRVKLRGVARHHMVLGGIVRPKEHQVRLCLQRRHNTLPFIRGQVVVAYVQALKGRKS